MIRNLKILGLALGAMLAFGALSASGASAQEQGVLTADTPVTLTGEEVGAESENQLNAFGGSVRCPGSTYTGHKFDKTPHELISSGETTATLTPIYKETDAEGNPNCSGSLGLSATVDMNGCDYVAHIGDTTPAENEEGTYGVTFDVDCEHENEITVTIWLSEHEHTTFPNEPYCEMHISDTAPDGETTTNQGLTGAHITDEGNDHLKLEGKVENIHVKRTLTGPEPNLLCSNSETENGSFNLNVTVSGHDGGEEPKETKISLSH